MDEVEVDIHVDSCGVLRSRLRRREPLGWQYSVATRPVGAASRFKLVHNLILGLNRAALAEGLAFAEALGFDASDSLSILRETPATSAALEAKGEKMAKRDFNPPQARLSQHLKDVRLIRQLAEEIGAATPLSDAHQTLLKRAEALGLGESDNSAVIEALRRGNL